MPIINFHSNKHENKFVSSNFIPVFLISPTICIRWMIASIIEPSPTIDTMQYFNLSDTTTKNKKKGQNKHSIVTLPITAHVNVWTNRWTGLEKCFLEIFKWYFSGSRH